MTDRLVKRNATIYFLGRLGASLGSIGGLVLVGRISGTTALGQVTVQVAAGTMGLAVLVQPNRQAIARFWQAPEGSGIGRLLRLGVMAVGASAGIAVAVGLLTSRALLLGLTVWGLHVACVGAHETALEVDRAEFRATRYAVGLTMRNVGTLGFLAVGAGAGHHGATLALAWPFGAVLALMTAQRRAAFKLWGAAREGLGGPSVGRSLAYGVATAASALLSVAIIASDRLLLAGLVSSAIAGVYAVAYDFGHEAVYVSAAVVNQASFPMLVSSVSSGAHLGASRVIVRDTFILLASVSLLVAGTVVAGAPTVARFLVNENSELATDTVSVAGVLGAIFAIKTFYIDVPLHIELRGRAILVSLIVAAVVGFSISLFAIPRYEVAGALAASGVSYMAAVVTAAVAARSASLRLAYAHLVGFVSILATLLVLALLLHGPSRSGVGAAAMLVGISGLVVSGRLASSASSEDDVPTPNPAAPSIYNG